MKLRYTLLLLCTFSFHLAISQIVLSGIVKDSETKLGIPYANLFLIQKKYGTACNEEGKFFIATAAPDTLLISMAGYEPKRIFFSSSNDNFTIVLKKKESEIKTIEIKKKKKKKKDLVAEAIIDKAIENKKKNNYENLDQFECRVYNRVQCNINNVDTSFADNAALKPIGFIFNSIDSVTFDKPSVPILFSESYSRTYYKNNPRREKEIIEANKISGIDNMSMAEFSGNLYLDYNIYDDYINAFQKDFISPLAVTSGLSYKYFLNDSLYINDRKTYKIYFFPRRSSELTFYGTLWIDSASYSLTKFDMTMSKDANINLVKRLSFQREYAPVNDAWMPMKEEILIELNLQNNKVGFYGLKKTQYSEYKFDQHHDDDFYSTNKKLYLSDSLALQRDTAYWNKNRPEPLSSNEKEIYQNIDSVMNTKYAKRIKAFSRMIISGFYPLGKFEYGPYYTTYSFNALEGNRFRVGGSTTPKFHKKIRWQGYVAYGTTDHRIKYSSIITYYFHMVPRMYAAIDFSNDLRVLNSSPDAFLPDNILSSITRRVMPKYMNVERYATYFEKEWVKGINNRITFAHSTISPIGTLFFEKSNGTYLNNISTSTIVLSGRFASREKIVEDGFRRVSLSTKSPIITYSFESSFKGTLGSGYAYQKAKIKFQDRWYMGPLGYMDIVSEIGKTWGTVPYALLNIHYGNNSYYFDKEAFNLMNPFEFVSDQYAQAMVTHHFNGAIFNKVPLFRKLEFRELIFARGVYGTLTNENETNTKLPAGMSALKDPYLEVGFGVENIFKVLRIDALWRLTNLDNPDAPRFGITGALAVQF
ncbi:MAG: DUF5686 family protein [Flavobacteriales bacterium]